MVNDPSDRLSGILERLSASIADGDASAVISMFSDRAEVMMFGSEAGETARGPAAIAALWQKVLSRGQRYIWSWTNQQVTEMGDVAWISAEATVAIDDGSESRAVPYRATVVLTRRDGGWAIDQYHGSEPAAGW